MRIRSVSIRSFGFLRDRSYGVSEGMILAAQGPDGTLALLRPTAALPNGARLH